MPDFPLTGLPSSYRVPGQFGEVAFNQGPSAAAASAWDVAFVMPKLSAGTWTVNTRYRVKSEIEVRNGAGAGSPMHRAVKKFLENNKDSAIYCVPYAASSGGSPATATGTITWATTPTGTGVTKVRVLDRVFSVRFTSVDTVTTIAAAMVAMINAATELTCTASNSSGVLTLTAKIAGASQGDGTTGVIWYEAEIDSGLATTVTTSGAAIGLGAGTDGADGSTTEAANFAAALAVLESVRHYFICTSLWTETALDSLTSHIANKSEAKRGLRSVGIAAHTGTVANGQTLALTQNYERIRIAQKYHGDEDPAVLVGNVAAVLQKEYTKDCASNLDGYSSPSWQIGPTRNPAYRPDDDDLNDGINDGLLMIASNDSRSYIVMDCTTRSKDSTGAIDDFRSTEGHRVSVGDALMDHMMARAPGTFGNKKLRADPKLPDGITVDHAKLAKMGNVVTPHRSRGFFKQAFQLFHQRDQIMDDESSMASLQVGIDPDNGGRLESAFEFQAISLAHQFTVRASETNPG